MRKGELTNRIDCEYYALVFNMLSKSIFPAYSVGSQFYLADGDHNKFPEEHNADCSIGIRYLRSQDLKDGEIIDLKPIFVSKDYFNKIRRSEIRGGYILFSIMASVGSVVIYPENRDICTANRAVGILIPKKDNFILPQYFKALFNTGFGETLIQSLKKGGVQQRINLFDFSQLKIPIPPLKTQTDIINFFETAYTSKRQKEAEAAALLASIDGYLMQALGITLPQPTEKDTFFYTNFSKVSSGRIDPYCHQIEFEELEQALKDGKYEIKSFRQLAKKITSGTTPKSGGDDYTNCDSGIPFIRSGEINEFDVIDFNDVVYVKPSVHNGMLKSSQLKRNDLMIAIVGATIGQVGVFKYDLEANINQAIALIRFSDVVNVDFAKSFLITSIGQKVLDKLKRPVARANINLDEIASIKIPLPPLAKQNEIATHISDIRNRAKLLQQQAVTELESAKLVVEKLILGEAISD